MKYGKSYGTREEYEFRYKLFLESLAHTKINNARNDVTYKLALNKFSDWTKEEYRRLLGYRRPQK